MEFTVTWQIEVYAENPEEAAKRALVIQRDQNSIATVFVVSPRGPCPKCHRRAVHKSGCSMVAKTGTTAVDYSIEVDVIG